MKKIKWWRKNYALKSLNFLNPAKEKKRKEWMIFPGSKINSYAKTLYLHLQVIKNPSKEIKSSWKAMLLKKFLKKKKILLSLKKNKKNLNLKFKQKKVLKVLVVLEVFLASTLIESLPQLQWIVWIHFYQIMI